MLRSSHCGAAEMNLTSIHEGVGSIPGLAQWFGIWCCHELWCRLAAAALIRPLAWELPHAMGADLKRPNKKRKKSYAEARIFPRVLSFDMHKYLMISEKKKFILATPVACGNSQTRDLTVAKAVTRATTR